MKTIGFCLFDDYHQKKDIGSSRIRGDYLIKYMPEAERFIQGKKYEVVVFQKAYWKEYIREYKGIKILDLCDPDYLGGELELVHIVDDIDAITTSTEALRDDLKQLTDKPVICIPDRLDFDEIPKKKKTHKGKAKTCVWFGYSHNLDLLEETLYKIKKEGLTLNVITDGNFSTSICAYNSIKWDYETAREEIQKSDFALMPEYTHGKYLYKSNNKDTLCAALGVPVAKTAEDLERLLDEKERIKESKEKLKHVKDNYNVKESVKQLRELINAIRR